jgi:D-lyxose ketol-isomerase
LRKITNACIVVVGFTLCILWRERKMKRSEINKIIETAKEILHKYNIKLPPFAYWTPEEWEQKGTECAEIRDCMLGWDITDFGSGRFEKVGLAVFTLRNGHQNLAQYKEKTYCEKILVIQEEQVTPMHFHWYKVEDIINRAGGNMVIELYNSTEDEKLADTDVEVSLDGVKRRFSAGSKVVLGPGESITLTKGLYHRFWAEKGRGVLVAGEVSKVNDDKTDNRFLEAGGRFPKIEEDCPPAHLLCSEYPC